jgi:hypothetical protein
MMKSSEDFTGLLWQLDGPSFVAGCWCNTLFHPNSKYALFCALLRIIIINMVKAKK